MSFEAVGNPHEKTSVVETRVRLAAGLQRRPLRRRAGRHCLMCETHLLKVKGPLRYTHYRTLANVSKLLRRKKTPLTYH